MNNARPLRRLSRRFGALRRRPCRAALGGLGAVVLIAASVVLVVGQGERGDSAAKRATPPLAIGDPTPPASEPSTTVAPTTLEPATVAPTTTGTVGPQPPPVTAPTTAPLSPWQVSATSGLTNLAPVTITATGVPPDTYYVGQCPAGQTPSFDACVLNHAVVVTDGTLTSTVHAFWWLKGGQIDCGSAPGACVVGAMNTRDSAVVASFPISFDPGRRPTVTVTPDSSLTDGQTVVVRGVDVGEGTVRIGECLLPGDPACTFLKTVSRPDGSFTAEMTVSRVIDWWGRGGAMSSTCGIDGDCVVEVWLTPKGFDSQLIWINQDQPVRLQIAPAPPTSTLSPNTTTT